MAAVGPVTSTENSWFCYGCNGRPGATMRIPHLFAVGWDYLCPDCLVRLVRGGQLIVVLPNQITQPVVAPAAPAGPVATVNDDGSITVEGTSIQWDEA